MTATLEANPGPQWCLPCKRKRERTASASNQDQVQQTRTRRAARLVVDGPIPVPGFAAAPGRAPGRRGENKNIRVRGKTKEDRSVLVTAPRGSKRKPAQLRAGEARNLKARLPSVGEVEIVSTPAPVDVLHRVQCRQGCGGTLDQSLRCPVAGLASQRACKCKGCGAEQKKACISAGKTRGSGTGKARTPDRQILADQAHA